jgi:hypothetical protein
VGTIHVILYKNLFYTLLEIIVSLPGRYPYFGVVVGLAWSNDPESNGGSSVAAGRPSHAGHTKDDDPVKKAFPGPSGCGLGVRLTTSPNKEYIC